MKGVMTLTEKFDDYKRKDRIDSDYSDYKEEYAARLHHNALIMITMITTIKML